jgi:hypothetical protein
MFFDKKELLLSFFLKKEIYPKKIKKAATAVPVEKA